MRAPRGTTVRIEYREGRPKPYGVIANVYEPGRLTRRQPSTWYETREQADAVAAKTRELLAAGAPAPAVTPTRVYKSADALGALVPAWLRWVKDERAPATHRGYQSIVDHFLAPAVGHARYPGLGDLVVSDATLTAHAAYQYIKTLKAEGLPIGRRHSVKRALSAFCSFAQFELGKLASNPIVGMGRTLLRGKGDAIVKALPHPFTADQVRRFFDQLEAVDPQWAPYFYFLLDVGVRVGEAAALQWSRVDLDRGRATIDAAYCAVSKADKEPKTHEVRTVHLSARVVKQLTAWQAAQRAIAFRRGRPVPAYVFTTDRLGRMLSTGSNMPRVLARTLAACARGPEDPILDHTAHDWRDTFATAHLIEDWDRKKAWVSKQLGHANIRTTETHYFGYIETARSQGFADDILRFGT